MKYSIETDMCVCGDDSTYESGVRQFWTNYLEEAIVAAEGYLKSKSNFVNVYITENRHDHSINNTIYFRMNGVDQTPEWTAK